MQLRALGCAGSMDACPAACARLTESPNPPLACPPSPELQSFEGTWSCSVRRAPYETGDLPGPKWICVVCTRCTMEGTPPKMHTRARGSLPSCVCTGAVQHRTGGGAKRLESFPSPYNTRGRSGGLDDSAVSIRLGLVGLRAMRRKSYVDELGEDGCKAPDACMRAA